MAAGASAGREGKLRIQARSAGMLTAAVGGSGGMGAWARRMAAKPAITLDAFFDSAAIDNIEMSPDGRAVVVETERADWERDRYRHELWLWREGTGTAALTTAGFDHGAQWSPDGRWIAFLSERPAEDPGKNKDKTEPQIWVIAAAGGEAFQATRGDEGVHAFAWAGDSKALFFATREPWSKERDEAYKKEWNDVVRFRESERGDAIFRASTAAAMSGKPVAERIAASEFRVTQIAVSPDGKRMAFATEAPSERVESVDPFNLYLMDLPAGKPAVLSHTQAQYENLQWAPDGGRIFFEVVSGSIEGKYRDVQPRLYSIDTAAGKIDRWAAAFSGAVAGYAAASDGGVIVLGMLGTGTRVYRQRSADGAFDPLPSREGTYGRVSVARSGRRAALIYSSLAHPMEVYIAEDFTKPSDAAQATGFNAVFADLDLPKGESFRWKADDGAEVEGMLIYPPGKFRAKGLRTLTLIHGGPADADGDRWGADWYDWAILAASKGWLVFRPNYRGSTGYGDEFAMQTVPEMLSRPGKDILEGVDALVKAGIADAGDLMVGGYSEGGYLTNWLITQTDRFRAAVTGAGAVEHVVDWGNDDETFDDAFYLGGNPWEAKERYDGEAAIWRIDKVKTPVHIVVGADDIRVHFGEAYLLERALHVLGVPCALLVFPGEGHSLANNPWHGKIKVREELKWMEKYAAK